MMSSARLVARSAGDISSVAVARQWMQRRLQPLVTSQKISRGLYSFLPDACVLPSPAVMIIFPPPPLRNYGSFLCFQDRIPATRGPVSLITRACDVCHFGGRGVGI